MGGPKVAVGCGTDGWERSMNIGVADHEVLRQALAKAQGQNWLIKHRWLLLFVGVPTVLAAVYYGFIASPIYTSESSFVIKSPGQKALPTLSFGNLVQTSGLTAGQEQAKEVIQYIHSRSAMDNLLHQTNLVAAYSRPGIDFLSRFPQPFEDSSAESLYRYYTSRVGIDSEGESGLTVLQVQAFTPGDAYNLNAKLLELSEAFVNRLNSRAERRAVAEDEQRVAEAEQRVRNASIALSAYQNQQDLIDPTKQAAGVLDISNKLVADQAAMRAQLELMERLAPSNPAIPALRSRIQAVGREIASQSGRVVGTPTGIASKLANYQKLQVEQEFATQMLTAANTALEQARTDAQKQQFYLERVVEPNRPDEPTLPRRLKGILTVFGASVFLYFIGWMFVVGILEHSPED